MTPIQQHINILKGYADYIAKEADQIGNMVENTQQPNQWMPATQVPNDDTDCVIIDEHGSRYFLSPINGHWPKRVKYWCPLPKMP